MHNIPWSLASRCQSLATFWLASYPRVKSHEQAVLYNQTMHIMCNNPRRQNIKNIVTELELATTIILASREHRITPHKLVAIIECMTVLA